MKLDNMAPKYGNIDNTKDLGKLIRSFRKKDKINLEKVCGLSNTSMRFLSELERGKQTAEIGKIFEVLKTIGLEVYIFPRGYTLTDKDMKCL